MTQRTEKPVALITGGRRGIGLAIARDMAKAGYDLALTGIGTPDTAEAVLAELAALGANALYLNADISVIEHHEATVQAVLERFGRIDCLINNAGMASVLRGDFLDLDPENFDRIIATNLRGTVFFSQKVAKAMLARVADHPRSIINITSVSAELTSPERLDYCISKAGLSAFSRGLALRLAESGIAVFELRPGIIRTDMTAGVTGKYDKLIDEGLVPMRRWGEGEDIACICVSLAGGAFAFATGSVIDADGGLSIPRL